MSIEQLIAANTEALNNLAAAIREQIAACGAATSLETYRDWETDRKSTRLNSSHSGETRMPSSA